MPVRGEYADGYPIGAVVHNTEGYSKKGDENAEDTMKDGIGNGYCYFCISSTGKVYQPAPLKNWGYHCGPTYHPTMGRSLAQKLVGIEVCNAGLLVNTDRGWQPRDFHKDYPDRVWHETFADDERRDSPKVFNVTVAGVYHGMTATQETALTELLLWMHQNNPHVFKLENVVGHDEVAVEGNGTELGRKQDPGASLSLYMPAFRTKLQQLSATS
jgi:N-acetyl-anhydromuramyl-L-alanine amidase AmpD